MTFNKSELDRFNDDGFIIIRDLFSVQEVNVISESFDRILELFGNKERIRGIEST